MNLGICASQKPTVLIISGHTSLFDKGALSFAGKPENEFNDYVVKMFFEDSNRIDDLQYVLIPSSWNLSIQEKVKFSEEMEPDLYIEIHHDSGKKEDIERARNEGVGSLLWEAMSGFCILYYDDGAGGESKFPKESLCFAEFLSEEMKKEGFIPNKYHAFKQGMQLLPGEKGIYNRVKPNSLYVLRNAISPAIILECGFIINPDEEKILSDPATHQKVANAINNALFRYFIENRPKNRLKRP